MERLGSFRPTTQNRLKMVEQVEQVEQVEEEEVVVRDLLLHWLWEEEVVEERWSRRTMICLETMTSWMKSFRPCLMMVMTTMMTRMEDSGEEEEEEEGEEGAECL